jgi:excisionase family DNA binding protein
MLMLFNTRQVAHSLGVSPSYICRLCRQGRIFGLRVSRDWVITRDELVRWLKHPKVKAGRPRKIRIGA